MEQNRTLWRSVVSGVAGMAALLGVYFVILASVSGWEFTVGCKARFEQEPEKYAKD
jgi:hypothetical protein